MLVEYSLTEESSVLIDARDDTSVGNVLPAGKTEDLVVKATQSFEEAIGSIAAASESVLAKLQDAIQTPSELTLEFGARVGAKAGFIITEGTADANLKVTIKWTATKNT